MPVDIKKVVEGTDEYDDETPSMWFFHFEEDQCCGSEDDERCENRFFDGYVKVHAPTLTDIAAELYKIANEILDSV